MKKKSRLVGRGRALPSKQASQNRWLVFLRETTGLKMTRPQRKKLYSNWLQSKGGGGKEVKREKVRSQGLPPLHDDDAFRNHLKDDMSCQEMCAFVNRLAPLRKLGFCIVGVVGSGSYGLVLDLLSSAGEAYVMKVSRITEEKLPPVRFPVLNNQKTSWHTIRLKDFKRGVRAQQHMSARFKSVRIPKILHAGCVQMNSTERMGLIIMEKVKGRTLRKVLACEGISEEIKLLLVRKAARISANFHRGGCIHGDGPHTWNMICDGSGHIHVIDFDRSSVSHDPSHRMHDLGMMMDTMDSRFWQCFCDSYFGVTNSPNPFILPLGSEEERKRELHEQSRHLFKDYLMYLKSK